MSCHGEQKTKDPTTESYLQLQMNQSVQGSIDSFLAEEDVEGVRWNNDVVTVKQRFQLTSANDILIIQLKRFGVNSFTQESWKDERIMTLDSVIRIPVGMEVYKYTLECIIEHIGKSPHIGHYKAYLRIDNRWRCCDDHRVTDMTEAELPASLKKQSYLLFYRCVFVSGNAAPSFVEVLVWFDTRRSR